MEKADELQNDPLENGYPFKRPDGSFKASYDHTSVVLKLHFHSISLIRQFTKASPHINRGEFNFVSGKSSK